MIIRVRDKVRSHGGVEGEVVRLDAQAMTALIRVPRNWPGTNTVSIPLGRLAKIEEYSPAFAGPFK
jgi:hypothetical protein